MTIEFYGSVVQRWQIELVMPPMENLERSKEGEVNAQAGRSSEAQRADWQAPAVEVYKVADVTQAGVNPGGDLAMFEGVVS